MVLRIGPLNNFFSIEKILSSYKQSLLNNKKTKQIPPGKLYDCVRQVANIPFYSVVLPKF